MPIIRNVTDKVAVITTYHMADRKLSLKAKGLLSAMLSLPEEWDLSVEGLPNICKESEEEIKEAIDELIERGYIVADVKDGVEGYTVLEKPREVKQCDTIA